MILRSSKSSYPTKQIFSRMISYLKKVKNNHSLAKALRNDYFSSIYQLSAFSIFLFYAKMYSCGRKDGVLGHTMECVSWRGWKVLQNEGRVQTLKFQYFAAVHTNNRNPLRLIKLDLEVDPSAFLCTKSVFCTGQEHIFA